MSFEDKVNASERKSELIPDLRRDLWYESEEGLITREIMRKVLADYLSKNLSVSKKLTGFKEATGHRVIFTELDISVGLIMGRVGRKELTKLHGQIKKATGSAKEELGERQIAMLADAIRSLSNERGMNEEVHAVIEGLLKA